MSKTTVIIKFDPRDPDLSRLREVARAAREGKVVAFPTETVYGIGLPMSVAGAAETLAALKNRPAGKPFAYHIGEPAMIDLLKVKRSAALRYLMSLFWPGPLTLLVENDRGEKLGLRFPRNRSTTSLFNTVGEPFLGTSANPSGASSPVTADEVMTQLEGRIDYLIDGGKCELSQDSTVVDMTGETPEIVREGAMGDKIAEAVETIRQGRFPRKRVLLVCTGNSCRTPMAEGWLKMELRRKRLEDEIEVRSCGIAARPGMPATPEAILVMKNREIDISRHLSRMCTREEVANADLIYAMTQDHYNFITGLVPGVKAKCRVLDIPDPIGMGLLMYEEVVGAIERKLRERWDEVTA